MPLHKLTIQFAVLKSWGCRVDLGNVKITLFSTHHHATPADRHIPCSAFNALAIPDRNTWTTHTQTCEFNTSFCSQRCKRDSDAGEGSALAGSLLKGMHPEGYMLLSTSSAAVSWTGVAQATRGLLLYMFDSPLAAIVTSVCRGCGGKAAAEVTDDSELGTETPGLFAAFGVV